MGKITKASTVLRKAREMLSVEGVWGKGDDVRQRGKHCLVTAIALVSKNYKGNYISTQFVTKIIMRNGLARWNDAPSRTLSEVLSALSEAEKLAKKEGN